MELSGMGFRGAFVRYTLARLGLFVVTTVALAAVGLRGFPLLAVSLLASSLLGLFVLRRLREAFTAASMERTAARREQRAQLRARLEEEPPA